MNRITVGDYAIDTDAVVWANMNAHWNQDIPKYREDADGFRTRIGLESLIVYGVHLHYVDGTTMTVPDGTPGITQLRMALAGTESETLDLDAYSPIENEVIAGLPEDLRATIMKGEQ
jgi:hypothetical protein